MILLGRFPRGLPPATYDEATGTLRIRRALAWRCRLGERAVFHGWYQRYGPIGVGIYGVGTELRMFVDEASVVLRPSIRAELHEHGDGRILVLRDGGIDLLEVPLPPVPPASRLERVDTITNPLAYREDVAEMIAGLTAAPHEHVRMAERWCRGITYQGFALPLLRRSAHSS